MMFSDAIKALNDGKYVTRTGWNDGSYLVLLPSMPYIWKVATVPNPAAGNWLPLNVDLLADDWITVDGLVAPAVVEPAATPDAA